LRRKITWMFFALLLLAITAFVTTNAIIPCLADSDFRGGSTGVLDNFHIAPDSDAIALIGKLPSKAETLVSRDDSATMTSVRGICRMVTDVREQAELISQYIRKQNGRIDELTALKEAFAFICYSTKYGVPLDLAIAVANTESHFDPQARSKHGSAGVMQVTWRVHSALLKANGIKTQEELHDPVKGIAAGTLLISRYLKAYGTPKEALGRYYGGSASVYWSRISKNLAKLKEYKD